ncbi:hypothetical protein J6590_019558 [Homalodisca vitripennis]|nr:hypothetical protein J6590_019558 [Homalodisca vitripennis]
MTPSFRFLGEVDCQSCKIIPRLTDVSLKFDNHMDVEERHITLTANADIRGHKIDEVCSLRAKGSFLVNLDRRHPLLPTLYIQNLLLLWKDYMQFSKPLVLRKKEQMPARSKTSEFGPELTAQGAQNTAEKGIGISLKKLKLSFMQWHGNGEISSSVIDKCEVNIVDAVIIEAAQKYDYDTYSTLRPVSVYENLELNLSKNPMMIPIASSCLSVREPGIKPEQKSYDDTYSFNLEVNLCKNPMMIPIASSCLSVREPGIKPEKNPMMIHSFLNPVSVYNDLEINLVVSSSRISVSCLLDDSRLTITVRDEAVHQDCRHNVGSACPRMYLISDVSWTELP